MQPSAKKKPNRVRKALSTTVDPDVWFVIHALSDNKSIGVFVEEAITQWLLNCAYFDIPGTGPVQLRYDYLYYMWVDLNGEETSPCFRTFQEALTWLKVTYPEVNYNIKLGS